MRSESGITNEVKEKIFKHLMGGRTYDRLTTGLKCNVVIETFSEAKFNVSIKDLDGNTIKDFNDFNLGIGDVIQISGLGHHIELDDGMDIPPILNPKDFEPRLEQIEPQATLKRKMDIDE